MKPNFHFLLIVMALFASVHSVAAQGILDTSFNIGTGAEDVVQTLAVQSDGKIVVAGLFYNINGTTNSLGIARLNTNGVVDGNFNPGASVDYGINSVAVQTDGKIILGGGFTMYQGASRNGITRINSDGSRDDTFDPGTGVDDQITAVALQPDGKVVIGGYFTSYNGTGQNGIARVNTNGTLDVTFDPGSGVDFAVSSVQVLTNGQILLAGGFTMYNGVGRRGVARINSNGSLDATFNPGASVDNLVRTAIAQPDGKVIIGGDFTTVDGHTRNEIARLNADGTLDTNFTPGADNSVYTLAIQPNGKVLVGGDFTMMNNSIRGGIARLLPNGALDGNFDPGPGFTLSSSPGTVEALALQNDGKIVVGGNFDTFKTISCNYLARLSGADPWQAPTITGITPSAGNVRLNWTALTNGIYRVDSKSSLAAANWTALSPNVTATNNGASLQFIPAGGPAGYYRVAQLPF